MIAPEPSIEPAAASESKSRRISGSSASTSAAVSTGDEEPPGITAFSLCPPGIPPQMSYRNSFSGTPRGSS
jgi:hypothetical protein